MPISELVGIYSQQIKKQLSDVNRQRLCDSVYVSLVSALTLEEYILARQEYCSTMHSITCIECPRMLKVASSITEHGFCSLSSAFAVVSPDVDYTAE